MHFPNCFGVQRFRCFLKGFIHCFRAPLDHLHIKRCHDPPPQFSISGIAQLQQDINVIAGVHDGML